MSREMVCFALSDTRWPVEKRLRWLSGPILKWQPISHMLLMKPTGCESMTVDDLSHLVFPFKTQFIYRATARDYLVELTMRLVGVSRLN